MHTKQQSPTASSFNFDIYQHTPMPTIAKQQQKKLLLFILDNKCKNLYSKHRIPVAMTLTFVNVGMRTLTQSYPLEITAHKYGYCTHKINGQCQSYSVHFPETIH